MPSAKELTEESKSFAPEVMITIMSAAVWQVIETVGPNQMFRTNAVAGWVEWWRLFYAELCERPCFMGKEVVENPNVMSVKEMGGRIFEKNLDDGTSTGVLLMATGDGTAGHRYAANWMKRFVQIPIVLLEQDGYFKQNPDRRKPYFPPEVRLTMWAHFGVWTGLIPDRPKELEKGKFYDDLVKNLGVDYSFATVGDPNLTTKIVRGKKRASFTTIPNDEAPHGSDLTRRLF